jgi:hypothetical protein
MPIEQRVRELLSLYRQGDLSMDEFVDRVYCVNAEGWEVNSVTKDGVWVEKYLPYTELFIAA